MKQKIKGFTLVEMAIVMVIIGFIVGGVLVGKDLIREAELKSVVQDVQNYKTAVGTFQIKYLALPGDMVNAFDFWNPNCGTDALAPAGCNGDSDGRVEIGGENLRAWQHLSLSGILDNTYTGVKRSTTPPASNDGDILAGENVPASKISGAAFGFYYNTGVYGREGNYFEFGQGTGNRADSGIIPAREASVIDQKVDNGLADSGSIVANDNNCVTGTALTAPATYTFGGGDKACALIFWYE